MTISKAYTLLEAEGLLERQRGKPMRIAGRKSLQAPLAQRLRKIEGPAAELALAARQLGISKEELVALLGRKWEDSDV